MQAGKLRHRVHLQEPTETRDGYGGVTLGWSTAATLWASVEPLRGRELLEAQRVGTRITHRVRLRERAGVNHSHRIALLDGTGAVEKILNIDTIIRPEERGIELELLCIEDQDVGSGEASGSGSGSSSGSSSGSGSGSGS